MSRHSARLWGAAITYNTICKGVSKNSCLLNIFDLFVYCYFFLLEWWHTTMTGIFVSAVHCYPGHPEQCLAYSNCSINICLMTKLCLCRYSVNICRNLYLCRYYSQLNDVITFPYISFLIQFLWLEVNNCLVSSIIFVSKYQLNFQARWFLFSFIYFFITKISYSIGVYLE